MSGLSRAGLGPTRTPPAPTCQRCSPTIHTPLHPPQHRVSASPTLTSPGPSARLHPPRPTRRGGHPRRRPVPARGCERGADNSVPDPIRRTPSPPPMSRSAASDAAGVHQQVADRASRSLPVRQDRTAPGRARERGLPRPLAAPGRGTDVHHRRRDGSSRAQASASPGRHASTAQLPPPPGPSRPHDCSRQHIHVAPSTPHFSHSPTTSWLRCTDLKVEHGRAIHPLRRTLQVCLVPDQVAQRQPVQADRPSPRRHPMTSSARRYPSAVRLLRSVQSPAAGNGHAAQDRSTQRRPRQPLRDGFTLGNAHRENRSSTAPEHGDQVQVTRSTPAPRRLQPRVPGSTVHVDHEHFAASAGRSSASAGPQCVYVEGHDAQARPPCSRRRATPSSAGITSSRARPRLRQQRAEVARLPLRTSASPRPDAPSRFADPEQVTSASTSARRPPRGSRRARCIARS